ncbi:MAG: choice-of-anchor L domain-containing protein [Bryobacteraceae bacterium]
MTSRFCRPFLTLLASVAFAASQLVASPFAVTLTDDPSALASALFGPGVTVVGTPTLSSQPGQSGTFTNFNSGPYTQSGGASGQFNVGSGIILTTGIASGAEGNYIGGPSFDAGGSGNALLSAISGASTFDADVLTIQFLSTSPMLGLNFLFASAEYPGSVNSGFGNDPIGIFVNGKNVALVPGTSTPVSINSVNASANSSFFTQYSNPNTPFNYGGVTTVLNAKANVSTTAVNTIQFAIADAVDGSVDSALLIPGSNAAAVPEPRSLLLFLTGAALIGGFAIYRRAAGVV